MEGIIAQTAGKLAEGIFKTIKKIGLSDIGRTAEALLAVVKSRTLELLSAAIDEMGAAVLSAKKERKLDGLTVKERYSLCRQKVWIICRKYPPYDLNHTED